MTGRVLVLGGTGMLGNAVLEVLTARGIDVSATARVPESVAVQTASAPLRFDVLTDDLEPVVDGLSHGDIVVNCIGMIKHLLDDSNAAHRRTAIAVNSDFPYRLAALAEAQGFRMVQIATDCVYSGATGHYTESSAHDATDVYGQSKSLGEVPSPNVLNLRCSIIGRELSTGVSLLEWVLAHEAGSRFSGYTDHRWNGVTARAFGEIVAGLVSTGSTLSGSWHLIPADEVDKSELSSLILAAWGRRDVTVDPVTTGNAVDRTLATEHPEVSARLWRDAGYDQPPTIARMVSDLAAVPDPVFGA